MIVFFGKNFAQNFPNFPKADKEKIIAFADHVENFGFVGLKGRNKSSDNVPKNDPNWLAKVQYAKQHRLWHYHIGIPNYQKSHQNDHTSKYVLHYILGDGFIKVVDLSPHPPPTFANA